MKTLRVVCLSAIVAGTVAAHAQPTYTAAKVVFNNPGTFTQQQLEDAANIHVGSKFSADVLSAAAQRLADTGYFDSAGAALEGKFGAMTVTFDIKPIPTSQMLHLGFENFVWLTRPEIDAAIRAKFPLFLGYLPENSPQQAVIKGALTEALAAKGVTAQVAFETIEPTLRHPARELIFRVARPAIRVVNVKLAGVSADLVPYVQKSVNATARTPYVEGPEDTTTADRILAPLQNAGYTQASLADVSAAPSAAADGVAVVLSATLNAGEVYRVSTISFAGSPLLSADSFAATAKLHTGDVAARNLLLETLAPIDAAYRRQGYMDVIVSAAAAPNAATHQIAYTVTVVPGEQYRVKEITTNGLDPLALADFDRGFKMKTGELYDPDYLTPFLKRNTALQALAAYSASFKAYADPATHTVDLVIDFYRTVR
jgi:outer membrane protein assembly factor BamA